MDSSFLTPIQFNDNPELALLEILKCALGATELALLATYPDNGECSERPRSEQEAYVFTIIHQINTLQAVLDEYIESIARLREWQNRERCKEDIPF
jgi:hypothetical protein